MVDEVIRARMALELARATSKRLWAENTDYAKTLDPARGVAGEEELRRVAEACEWQRKVYDAEHALFRAEHGTPGIVGSRGDYQWLTMSEGDITSFLSICPEIALGKYLAVTSIDSGPLRLTEKEKSGGWCTAEAGRIFQGNPTGPPDYPNDWKAAYSPRIDSIHGLPHESHDECCAGYDEVYVFEQHPPVEDIGSFASCGCFFLYEPECRWCTDQFWSEMERLRPESYLAEGTIFTVVTRNKVLFNRILSDTPRP